VTHLLLDLNKHTKHSLVFIVLLICLDKDYNRKFI